MIERCDQQLDIKLTIRDCVKKHIVDSAYEPKYGARPLRRKIQTDLEDALAEQILEGAITAGDHVVVTMKKGRIVFEKTA